MAGRQSGWVSRVALATGLGVAGAVGKWLWDSGFAPLLAALGSAWGHLLQSTTVSNWQWYLLAALAVHSVTYWAWRLLAAKTFSHSRFSQDSFFGAKWRWMYDTSGHPCHFVPYCGHCDALLVYDQRVNDLGYMCTDLHCEHCNVLVTTQQGDKNYVWSKAARHIDRLVRTGEWRQRPGMAQAEK